MMLPACAFGASPGVAAGPNMKEGLWEITITMHMPAGAGLPHTLRQCFKHEDIANLRGAPGPTRLDQPCRTDDYKLRGNTATWKMVCTGTMSMAGKGIIIYNGTSYSGKNTMAVEYGGQMQTLTTAYTGKYLGACKQ